MGSWMIFGSYIRIGAFFMAASISSSRVGTAALSFVAVPSFS